MCERVCVCGVCGVRARVCSWVRFKISDVERARARVRAYVRASVQACKRACMRSVCVCARLWVCDGGTSKAKGLIHPIVQNLSRRATGLRLGRPAVKSALVAGGYRHECSGHHKTHPHGAIAFLEGSPGGSRSGGLGCLLLL